MMREIVTILSGIISLASVALIFFAISGYREKALSVFALSVIGLTVLGLVFKVCNLIFKPILALGDVAVIGGVNKLLGAVMGAAEAVALSCLCYYLFDYILGYIGVGVL